MYQQATSLCVLLCPIHCAAVHLSSLQNDHTFKGYATESGTGLYAKALAATVGANHFNRVTWGVQDPSKPDSKRKPYGQQRQQQEP